jgi:alkylresorcinol/alkylpyrone synthase
MNGHTHAPAAARLLSLATAVPENLIDQRSVEEQARILFGNRVRDYERLASVFTSTGIERRYSVCPFPWFLESHGWKDRTAAYLEGATSLFKTAAQRALDTAGIPASAVDAVVTVSSTGIATPSLEARMLPEMGFRADVERVPIVGLGCAGGVTGLATASRLARTRVGKTVLLVAVELCTLAFRIDHTTKVNLIATSLFGDGAAAAVISSDTALASIATVTGATEHLWPRTLDIMGWDTDDLGFAVLLSRSLPAFVERRYSESFRGAMGRLQLDREQIGRVVCHPGGTRVLDAIEAALRLPGGALDHERTVMRDFGNMSSPTVLFVLERAIAAGLHDTTVLAALGPGFTASFAALEI